MNEDKNITPIKNASPSEKTTIKIELGDIIELFSPDNDNFNEEKFIVDFVSPTKFIIINVNTLDKHILHIQEDGQLSDNTINRIDLLYRNPVSGYAKQNNLLPGTWVNIHFGGDIPSVITGQITDLEEDMIEIKTYPQKELIYLNFNYSGLPEDIPIELIEIRNKPDNIKDTEDTLEKQDTELVEDKDITQKEKVEEEEEEQQEIYSDKESGEIQEDIPALNDAEDELDDTVVLPAAEVKEQLHKMLLEADDIIFGMGEELAPVEETTEKTAGSIRYSIESQANDMLDELLSTIPDNERTRKVLYNIHTMIERFKQLRTKFSVMDEHGNALSPLKKGDTWKPLSEQLLKFQHSLYWVLPVVKYVKKIYNVAGETEDMPSDVITLQTTNDISHIQQQLEMYKANIFPSDYSKYAYLSKVITDEQRPFQSVNPEQADDVIYTLQVGANIQSIVNTLGNIYSSVVKHNNLSSTRFVIQKYNLGEKTTIQSKIDRKTMTYALTDLTEPDTMSIGSIVTLQEPVVRFSKINLPSTSILERSNLNAAFLNYWQLLRTLTKVESIKVHDDTLLFDEANFLTNIRQYTIDKTAVSSDYTKDELYHNFAEKIVPTTELLFKLSAKYLQGKMSFVDAIHQMEPYLLTTDDVTNTQFTVILDILKKQIADKIKTYVQRGQAFFKLRNIKSNISLYPSAEAIYNAPGKLSKEVFKDGYDYTKSNILTNSELLRKILSKDAGRLYNSAIAFDNIGLMFPENIAHIFQDTKTANQEMLKEYAEKDDCKRYVISKQYTSMDDIEADNNRDIYYDKKFDATNYSLIDQAKYQQEMATKDHNEFIEYLVKDLEKSQNLSTDDAVYLAETLITGMKKVREGDYAFIFEIDGPEDGGKLTYFERINNVWKPDTNVDKSMFLNDEGLLCNLQNDCIKAGEKCESTSLNKTQLEEKALKNMLAEFDEKYLASKERMEGKIRYDLDYAKSIIEKIANIHVEDLMKYNNMKVKLGQGAQDKLQTEMSPYYRGLQRILGQGDFVKKQHDIIRFCMQFTRKALDNTDESRGWRYCIKTSVPLIPEFRYTLAASFINTPDEYLNTIEELKATIGKISDDGNAWVDKDSGEVIVVDNFVQEDTYVDGFKEQTRGLLEKDAADGVIGKLKTTKKQSHEMKVANNVVTAMSNNMGINIEDHRDFIIGTTLKLFHAELPDEKDYNIRVKEAAKDKKKLPTYNELYNTRLLYMILSTLLISIQTSVPPITTKRTFPGCVTSFKGFPFEGNGDDSAVNYIACVAYNIRNSTEPWKILLKKKQTTIATILKNTIQQYFLQHTDVVRKFQEKAEYLVTNPPNVIPDELIVNSVWANFLPPLVEFNISPLHPLTTEFKARLLEDLKSGYSRQREDILVVKSKIILFSLAVQQRIQGIVGKETPLLKNIANEPFVENSCCDTNVENDDALQYFIRKDKEIAIYNERVDAMSEIISNITMITRAGMFYSPINTKNVYPALKTDFGESTIYQAYVVFCRFNSILPTPTYLEKFCQDKPLNIRTDESMREIIMKLKNDGRVYSNDSLVQLYQAVSRENIVLTDIHMPKSDYIQALQKHLHDETDEESPNLDETFVKLMKNVLDTYDINNADPQGSRELKNFLARENREMKNTINDFINEFTTNKTKRTADVILDTILEFDEERTRTSSKITDSYGYNYIHALYTTVLNLVKIYPEIILNRVDYQNNIIPSYWKLSQTHNIDIKNIISKDLEPLRAYYSKSTIRTLLATIQDKGMYIADLMKTTPYFTSIPNNDDNTNVFDQRTSVLLAEYYFLSVLKLYVDLTHDPNSLYVEEEQTMVVENVFTTESLQDNERRVNVLPQTMETELLREGDKRKLQIDIANLLESYINIVHDTVNIVQMSYDTVMDKVFRHTVAEKDQTTEKLALMSEEERIADTMLKINKLGDWGKGLRKGIISYDADVYDEEREQMAKIQETQKLLLQRPEVEERNLEQYMQDYNRELEDAAEIDRDVYDMSHMNEDYDDGNYGADEIEDYDSYN